MRVQSWMSAAAMLLLATWVQAATVNFTANLSGANERPDPVDSPGSGAGSGVLTGENGSWVFTYNVQFSGLTSAPGLGHIHDAINPGGQPFTEQFGPVIHDLDSLISPIAGDWRFDDAEQPLTDAHAASLLAGRMYFNFHTELFPAGEIRGQIIPEDAPPPPNPIPLPAPLAIGLVGLCGAGLAAWKRRHGRV